MVNTMFLIQNVISMAVDYHSCCFNLVKERVDGKSFLCPTYNMAYTGKPTNFRTRRWF